MLSPTPERPYSYLLAISELVEAVQRIHQTEPAVAPLTLEQIHFWLQQVTLEDLQSSLSAEQEQRSREEIPEEANDRRAHATRVSGTEGAPRIAA